MDLLRRIVNWDVTLDSFLAGMYSWAQAIFITYGWWGALAVTILVIFAALHFPLTHSITSLSLADLLKLSLRLIFISPFLLAYTLFSGLWSIVYSILRSAKN